MLFLAQVIAIEENTEIKRQIITRDFNVSDEKQESDESLLVCFTYYIEFYRQNNTFKKKITNLKLMFETVVTNYGFDEKVLV